MVVRAEVDAYRPSRSTTTNPSRTAASSTGGIDDLAAALQRTSIQTTARSERVSTGDTMLLIQEAGTIAPQDSIAELKTVSVKGLSAGRVRWEEIMLQLFIAQTPHLFLGVHDRGNFVQVRDQTMSSPEMKAAEAKVKPSLLKLRRVLEDIKKLVIAHGEAGRLTLICRDGRLDVVERTSQQSCLPAYFLKKFNE